jgi:TIR domain/Pentapeptide repeats (8 copies)
MNTMADAELVERLKWTVQEWNQWRRQQLGIRSDLSGGDFSGGNFSSANLSFADLSNADFSSANLSNTDLSFADLSGANLSNANLSNANLRGTNLDKAYLNGTYLVRVRLWDTVFAHNDLSTVKGLVEVQHEAPSRIELYTVKLPQDGSALYFLRGAGVPDEWIDIYRSTLMVPIQYYSCFLSYSSSDEMLARRLHADLQDQGVRCWFAPHDLHPGQLIRQGLDEAIRTQDKLLLILSEHSVNSSWVDYEVEKALAREVQQQREILFPIRIDDAIFVSTANWAANIRRMRHIGDFRQWADPEHYQKAFAGLMRDLIAGEPNEKGQRNER